jgi:hypothetical protein
VGNEKLNEMREELFWQLLGWTADNLEDRQAGKLATLTQI